MRLDELIERDGPRCIWCGGEPWRRDLTAEHLLPRARRGRGEPANLAVACRSCNHHRRTRGVAAYARARLAAGEPVALELVRRALSRLSSSPLSEHAAYGQRQLELVDRLIRDDRPPAPATADAVSSASAPA